MYLFPTLIAPPVLPCLIALLNLSKHFGFV
ncbi:MAG: hypothetical protein OJF50_006370 [Nitrospira sp.]|nr:hypothetical protein [Nitrospira sp.]